MGKVTKIAIDADSFAYRLGPDAVTDNFYSSFEAVEDEDTEGEFEGVQKTDIILEDLGNGNVVETSLSLAKESVGIFIDSICKGMGCKDYKLYVSPGSLYTKAMQVNDPTFEDTSLPNFRYKVAEALEHAYKHNRVGLAPPAGTIAIMYSMIFDYGAEVAIGCEADDLVCALARDKGYTVAALDKDVVNQTAGQVWNYGAGAWVATTPAFARYYKYWQAICGDPGDGYKGVPGVGKVAAEKILSTDMSELELFKATLACYESKGLGLQECLATLQLADMHQLKFVGSGEEYFIDLYQPPEGFEYV